MYGGRPPWSPLNMGQETVGASRARAALLAGIGAQVVSLVTNLIYFNEYAPVFRESWRDVTSGRRTTFVDPATKVSSGANAANALGQVAGLVAFAVVVLFLMWFYRALVNAQALGLPLRRSPAWGVVSVFIPIIQLWFPFQSACDLFPAGHPDRKVVGRWWACYLGAGFASFVSLVSALLSNMVVAYVAAPVSLCLYVAAGLLARDMIQRALAVHVELARAQGMEAPQGNSAGPPGMEGGAPPAATTDPWNPPPPKDPWASS
jgi:hypothetical protein